MTMSPSTARDGQAVRFQDQRSWPAITIRGLTKYFGNGPLYENFDLDIPRNRIMTVFGPNGCGKSTLINMIAGLTPFDGGEVLFDGKTSRETNIGYVFQNYRDALFPWKRAIDNIRYPLSLGRMPKGEIEARVEKLVAAFDIRFDLNRYPYELSGGQQQLTSIMRALVTEPEVLFLDEPFSALDYEMTLFIRDRLQQIFMETGTTMVLVSHDLEEAVWLADVVLLLTRRPTKVSEIIPFNAARPRTMATLTLPEFVETKRHTLEVFQREVNA
ncbi:ABC transporter ATP-binding protein [Camelimonas abortus]|uniref:ABC transporter ATP-binding protein n=1 Tax=Camelimonas abortus TaxID=1017184 RepID=A0ABV7LGX1_9HYPH